MASSRTDPLLHTYGSPDVFGHYHYNDGNTKFDSYERSDDDEITAYDAFAISELYKEYIPPDNAPVPPSPTISPGQAIPRRMIVTSPNVDWMPYISLRARDVRAREDGRFAWADFTLCPQWFIETQWHLPFVRTRPPAATIKSHELSFCWWEMSDHHFIEARGSAFRDLGTLEPDIADAFRAEAKKLHLACRSVQQHKDPGRLFYLANKTTDAALQLKFCNFTRRDLVYRIACFQRLYLETLAMYEWHKKWTFRLNDTTGKIYEVDESIMGAITDSPDCIAVLYRVGAPAWYVRPPGNIPRDMTIRAIVAPGWDQKPNYRGRSASEYDPREFTSRDYPNTPFQTVITASPRSGAYVAACQQWREGHFGPIVSQTVVKEPLATAELMQRPVGFKDSLATPSRTELSRMPRSESSTQSLTTPARSEFSRMPRSEASTLKQENAALPSVNAAKFREPELDFVPRQSPAWKHALASVDTDPRRIISEPSTQKFRGYQFPDPFLFITGVNHRAMILAWLMMRGQWLQSLVDVDSVPHLPMPQHWRNFLHDFARDMHLLPSNPSASQRTTVSGGVTKNKGPKSIAAMTQQQRRSHKAKEAQGSIFSGVVKLAGRPNVIFWGDVAVMQGNSDLLSAPIMAQVIWNAFEQNFRYEIRHLDHLLLPVAWASDSAAGLREDLIRHVFPDDSDGLLVAERRLNQGLAAGNWRDRLNCVEALRRLMVGWPGEAAWRLKARYISSDTTQTRFEETERMVVCLYCQTFFDTFGRAPCTPHQVPFLDNTSSSA